MPIRNIDVFFRELKLTQEARIGVLAETRLGIEGHNWLRQLMLNTRDGEPAAMGGVPLALEAEIVKELHFFQSNNITPIFVFNGLPVARRDGRGFVKDDHRPAYRHAAWEQYWQGHTEQALRGWSTSSPQALADTVPFVMQVLQAHGAEFMRAPYSSWAQLAYMYQHESQPIHAVYSSLEMLMFDVDRVVTSVNHSRATFGWIQRDNMLGKCGITANQVLDMCILAGCDWCPTFPPLLGDIGFSFKSAVDVTRQYRSGFNAIQAMADHPGVRAANYSDSFLRAYCTVKYHIVLRLDGSVGPLNAEFAPNDLHDIIGYRLPTAAYHLLAQGAVQPPILNMLVSGTWLEFSPPDNGESEEYRHLVTQWESDVLRQQCRLLCTSLGTFFSQRKIALQSWFDPQSEVVLHDSKSTKLSVKFSAAGTAAGAKDGGVSVSSVLERSRQLLGAGAGSGCRAAELLAWVLQSLQLVAADGQHTPLGRVLGVGLRALHGSTGPQPAQPLQWAVVTAAVLLDRGLLSGKVWSVAYEDQQRPTGDAKQEQFARAIARIATLVPPGTRRGPWKLAYNRDLLAFCSAARLVQKAVNSSADAACLIGAAGSGAEPASESTQSELLPLLRARRTMPLECATSDATGLLAHALLTDYARSGVGCWGRIQAAAEEGLVNAQQALRDAWSVAGAVRAMAKARGGTNTDIIDACDWAQAAFNEVL
ncbi:hypothetical protein H4S02_008457 [Coemansia sp. RSA 2611]|nr:hypothetical protein H4S02_008457 [Coemansia sp. RSA 2611]